MTVLEIKKTVLNNLIIRGETAKAMELFYADNVTMQENEDEPRVGKAVCIKHERLILKKVKEVNFRLLNEALDTKKNVVFAEWEITFITRTGKKIKFTEVSVQHWHKGQIIRGKFYYKDFPPIN